MAWPWKPIMGGLFSTPAAGIYGATQMAKNQGNAMMGNYNLANRNNLNLENYITLDGTKPVINEGQLLADTNTAPPIKNINRPLQDTYQRSPHRGFEEMQFDETVQAPEKKGFNFPSIFGTVKGGLEWLGDKFKRPEAKQRAYEAIMGDRKGLGTWETAAGDYGGNRFALTNTPTGLKVGSDIIGYGQGYAKNFDSMFGSGSLEEMEQKKIDWAMNRVANNKKISTRLRNALMQRGLLRGDKPGNVTVDTVDFVDKVGPTVGGDAGAVTTGGGGTFNPVLDPRGRTSRGAGAAPSWGGATAAREAAGQQVAGPAFGQGAYWAKGGRVGLRLGGNPEEPAENILDFMQDQNIPFGEMAEGVKQLFPSDDLGAINLNEEQMTIISDMNDKMETPDISLISTISGATEDAVERFIRLLNTQSQAQGGSVGYSAGGLAGLV